ncbi:MAG TPA: CAP domain-containing protein, partial [Blastocatellia bacterium]|nr:CAP domain-containing protein [Blastocatellia bacterium]
FYGLSLSVVAAAALVLPFADQVYSQQTGGVFAGKGKVIRAPRSSGQARPDRPAKDGTAKDRTAESEHVEDRRADDAYRDEDLKPMVAGRTLREIERLEFDCFHEVNLQREAHGLKPLRYSEELLEVARFYSRRMAEENFFSHKDPDGRTVRQRVTDAGITWRVVGENLAYSNGYINPVAVSVKGWMESPGHRKNILDPAYSEAAIGAWISSNGTVYFTEIFLKK